MTYSFTNKPPP